MKMNTLLLLSILFFSCNDSNKMRFAANDMAMAEMKVVADESLDIDLSAPPERQIIERKLIRNGSMTLKVKEVVTTKAEIEKICKQFNAYVSSESQSNYDERLQYDHTIRVPAASFDSLLIKIEKLAETVESKNINTQDVTEEFIDVEARLNTKKELEARYREILKQAKTVADIVSIESQIATVRGEIESMEGRLNYLKNQVSFSTLNLSYYEIIGTDFGFVSKLLSALANGWDNLLIFFIGLMNLWPFVLIISALGIVGWKRWRKRSEEKAS